MTKTLKTMTLLSALVLQTVTAHTQTPDTPLPIKAVTLFSSGVSYTVREGDVDGNATVPLTFRTTQINDILKSLVLIDEKGRVQPATYGAKDPIGRTLQSFAVDLTQSVNQGDLLNRLRGAKVEVSAGGTVLAASTMTPKIVIKGQIVGVESHEISVGDKTTTVETLTILGDDGLQSVKLSEVRAVKLLDERLNREFRDALSLVASGSDDRRRTVTLHFEGSGKRSVRVGYISEAPLWKISYRLLVAKEEKPYLQGWALVENTTDEDWNGVRLSLVSGRPVSFIQDLYQPLYLPRPIVPPDVVASPYPQLAESALESDKKTVGGRPGDIDSIVSKDADSAVMLRSERAKAMSPAKARMSSNGMNGGYPGGGVAPMVDSFAATPAPANAPMGMLGMREAEAQASGEKAGELFSYTINVPVKLPRQQAAMIPVVAQTIDGEKVSVYNADSGTRFPLNAIRVINSTKLHLKGGPVTVFDDDTYAGDARMEDIPPGDNRLITYAVDLSVEGERQYMGGPIQETSLTLRRGVLIVTRRERSETNYTLKNKSAESARKVLIEHPFSSEYTLITPKVPTERTANLYRFAVAVAPGTTEKLKVVTERPIASSFAVMDADLNSIAVYANRRETSEKMQTILRDIIQRRRRIYDLQSQAQVAEAEVTAIDKDQERIRKNMGALDKASALYQRYTKQLDSQESRIQTLRTNAAKLRGSAAEADRALRAYLDTVEISG